MNNTKVKSHRKLLSLAVVSFAALSVIGSSSAATIQWTDWTADISSSTPAPGFTGTGTITTTTSTVGVTYQNDNGISFFQNGVSGNLRDYFAQGNNGALGRDASKSPFTSAFVENIPTAAEMIALRHTGLQTLTFSEAIANPVFSYVSLNLNGYGFDQDFEILSFGNASDGNDSGYWGPGTSSKNIVDLGGGVMQYQLIGTGEPHGTIRFLGSFDSVSWQSLSSENWNGFTVGIEGTAIEVFPPSGVSDGGSTAFLAVFGLGALIAVRRLRP